MRKHGFALLAVAACGKSDKPADKPADPPKPEAKAPAMPPDHPAELTPNTPPAQPPQQADKSCTFSISGTKTVDADSGPGGLMAVNTSYWADEKTKKMMWKDGEGFLLNCNGKLASLSFVSNKVDKTSFPLGPKKLDVTKGGDAKVQFLGRMMEKDGGSFMGGTGTLDITAFDDKHIAGTFEVTSSLLSKDAKGEIAIKGTFDFKCPQCK